MSIPHSRASLIEAITLYGKEVQGPIRQTDFCRSRQIPLGPIYRNFPRGFGELLAAAGLQDRCYRIGRVTKQDLLAEIDAVVKELRRMPTRDELFRKARFSPTVYGRQLGKWNDVIAAYNAWQKSKSRLDHVIAAPRSDSTFKATRANRPAPGELFGPSLGFRGLLHEPTSESGVVYLFGLLAPDLDFAVEDIGSSYPDCRAFRPDPSRRGRWRRVRIEFEYISSNFRAHHHDAAKCDLIVCWEHDWPECPIEVLELKAVVVGKDRKLSSSS